jgi:ribosomal protein RSM22 (predicted rRNA methylase)
LPLPSHLQNLINCLVSQEKRNQSAVYNQMSRRYRQAGHHAGFREKAEVIAYIAARFPATYGVLQEIFKQLPADFTPQSLLDLGSGPGTASLAVREIFKTVTKFTLVESDLYAQEICHYLWGTEFPYTLLQQDLTLSPILDPHDMVILSYVLNEHPLEKQLKILEKAWQATQQMLLVVVPGTPTHFSNLMVLRQFLIDQKGFVLAPCPHHQDCPVLKREGDWCHFSVRIQRSSLHRQMKKAELAYEDEKYAYLLVSKVPLARPDNRIIRQPLVRSGHIIFDICEKGELNRKTVTKKEAQAFSLARKKQWGDCL